MKANKTKNIEKAKEKRHSKDSKQYVERNNVQFIGFDIIHPDDQQRIKDIIYKEYITLEREIKSINGLRIHFKAYEKGGRKKYSVQLFIDAQTRPITVNKMYSPVQWDPVAIVHKILDKAREEIVHKFKTDQGRDKIFNKREKFLS